jgi:adenine-specific DNA-methyltransferase
MKYMGAKTAMLRNGLGDLLNREIPSAGRFFDLFCGSAAVSWYVASRHKVHVSACDLQQYSAYLASAMLLRRKPLAGESLWQLWIRRAKRQMLKVVPPSYSTLTPTTINRLRRWCKEQHSLPITAAYGGYYFSPEQAITIDSLRKTVDDSFAEKSVELASLITAASLCAASPGHTAQPFRPTDRGLPFIAESWQKDVVKRVREAMISISLQHAQMQGRALIGDADIAIAKMKSGDLAFVDPPYSSVQYSRFYHVLETIAAGNSIVAEGTGRYPALEFRPQSSFSIKSKSKKAIEHLLHNIANRDARAIITFPDHDCSNGLSGALLREYARSDFTVSEFAVKNRFSTLGGAGKKYGNGRIARHAITELVLVLTPK